MGSGRNVTLKDVSVASGLSLITVSRALRQPELVHADTRAKVQRTIEELGYVPNLTARSLVSNRSNMIGVVVPILTSSLFADLAQGIAGALHEENIQMLLAVSQRSVDLEAEAVKTFTARQADAIIVTGFTHSESCRKSLTNFTGPIVETWNLRNEAVDMTVGYDNRKASAEMTKYLLAKGYSRIAMVGGAFENNDQAADRRDGFLDVMREAGRSVPPEYIVSVPNPKLDAMRAEGREVPPEYIVSIPNPTTLESGWRAMMSLLEGPQKPDAVFFQAEIPAHGAMMACLANGISVPGDVAIAGFGDLSLSAMLPVPLTTIKIPAREIGERAAQLVLERLNGAPVQHRTLDVGFELMIRESA